MQAITRTFLLLWSIAAAAALAMTLHGIATDPSLTPWRAATLDEITATTDAMLVRQASPETLAARITVRLAEDSRNWLALDALRQLATDRSIALPPDLLSEFDRLRAEDSGLLAQTGDCLTCAWDAAACSLGQVMLCQAPINLTPVGDVLGLARGLSDYATGDPMDGLDLSLSVVGLGATLAALPSGGSSSVVKAGAGLVKTAAKMGRISRPLRDVFETALKQGIRWDLVASTDWLADPALLVKAEAFAPATRAVAALDDLYRTTDLATVLHVLPMVDTADDAAGLARVAQAGAKGFVAKAEVLGKSRLLRATLRASRAAEGLFAAFTALVAGLSGMLASAMDRRLRGALKSALRQPKGGKG